ncbi:MAG: DUF3857 domain-containing protein [Spirochaetes bacterium]|nr:MAG: DUF3857 domain-containing protein [Spirochaetota bacterium]
MNYFRACKATAALIILLVMAESGRAGAPPEDTYLFQKSRGNYIQAFDALAAWTVSLDDYATIEINILRASELTGYPELYPAMLEWCDRLLGENARVASAPRLAARVQTLRNFLLLKAGRRDAAIAALDGMGCVREFDIIGPFKNEGVSEFESVLPPEKELIRDAEYQGKLFRVKWFRAATSLAGILDLSERSMETGNCLYYLSRTITVARKGAYRLCFGKSGYADMWIDGTRVFNNRKRHGFNPDQYCLEVGLDAGTHRLLVKLGDSHRAGVSFSLRITDEKGAPADVSEPGEKGAGKAGLPEIRSVLMPSTLSDSQATDARAAFLKGYYYYFTGLHSEEEREAIALFESAAEDSRWGAAARYYQALCEDELDRRDSTALKVLSLDPGFVEALGLRAGFMLDGGFTTEAFRLIDAIRSVNPAAASGVWMRANALTAKGFDTEALREARLLLATAYPSSGRAFLGEFHFARQDYGRALEQYAALYQMDRHSKNLIMRLAACHKELGNFDAAQRVLESGISSFPADATMRYTLAELVRHTGGVTESIPYLASARLVSPFDSRVLFDLGVAYHRGGKSALALYFLEEALSCDPSNYYIKQYIETLKPAAREGSNLLYAGEVQELERLAAPYADEPAVMLLDETMYRVLADGSYERSVRKIYKLQHESILDDFRQQYIVFDPAVDRITDVRCTVINDGAGTDAAEGYTHSLSEPESRLYYDVSARTVNLPSIRKGSVIDFRYRVKSEAGPVYHGAFSERVATGGEYRVMRLNIVVSFPAEKTIYCRLRGIPASALREIRADGRRVYRITSENTAPYRAESYMPPAFDLQPAAFFLSHRDWAEVQQWYASLLRNRAVAGDEMKKKLKEIVLPADGPEEKVRKIYEHVSAEVRYVGFELGIGGLQPRRADLAYATRMGDCKDMALVLAAFLQEAGISAKIALLRTRDKGEADFSIPSLGQFNHAICYADVAGGIFLDATAKMCGYRELPASDRDVNTLVVDAHGYAIVNTGGPAYAKNFDAARTEIELGEDGSARLSREIVKMGDFAPSARYDFAFDPQSRKQDIAGYWNGMFPGAQIGPVEVKSATLDAPVRYAYEVRIPAFAQISSQGAWLKAFFIPTDFYREYALMRTRELPLILPRTWETSTEIRFRLPRGYSPGSVPRSEKWTHPKYGAEFSYTDLGGGVIEARSLVRVTEYRLSRDDYPKFREFALFIARKEAERIMLRRDGSGGDEK